ncbi:MAG: twin-arginine translocation signal domain-containing protein, partial [Candidatus Thiodiazotropha sp.]
MKRRDFIKHAGGGTLALGAGMAGLKVAEAKDQIKWKMVTTWPKNFPGLGNG